jgi:hypothetical protein
VIFRWIWKIVKSNYRLHQGSFHLHGTTRIPLDRFSWNWCLSIFWKPVLEIQVSLKCDKNNGYLTWTLLCIYDILLSEFLEWEAHFMFNNFFWKLCCLWVNVEKYGTARQATEDNTIQCIACWITKYYIFWVGVYKHPLRICNTVFTQQQWLLERASLLCYTYAACHVYLVSVVYDTAVICYFGCWTSLVITVTARYLNENEGSF